MGRMITTESFILESKAVHGNLYNYDRVVYTGYKNRVEIFCIKHKSYFLQTPYDHITNHGCPECGKDRKKISQESYINYCKLLHDDKYDYSKVIYKNIRSSILIVCPIHGEFEQIAHGHKNGRGCPSCAKTGFDYNNTGYFYIQEIIDNYECIAYKFGITKNIKKRMRNQISKSKMNHNLIFSFESTGIEVFKLEQLIKESLSCSYLDKSIIPDGYTETLSPDDINKLEIIVMDFLLGEYHE